MKKRDLNKLTENEVRNLPERMLDEFQCGSIFSIKQQLDVVMLCLSDDTSEGIIKQTPIEVKQSLYFIARHELANLLPFLRKNKRLCKRHARILDYLSETRDLLEEYRECLLPDLEDDDENLEQASKTVLRMVEEWWTMLTDGVELADVASLYAEQVLKEMERDSIAIDSDIRSAVSAVMEGAVPAFVLDKTKLN